MGIHDGRNEIENPKDYSRYRPYDLPGGGSTKNKGRAYEIRVRRYQVSQLMLEGYAVHKMAKMLKVNYVVIYNDIRVLMALLRKESLDSVDEKRERMAMNLQHYVNFCWMRLKEIKNPSAGAKWGEEIRKGYKQVIDLYGLDADKNVNISHTVEKISKKKRDGVLEAAFNTVSSDPKLLPFPKNGTKD